MDHFQPLSPVQISVPTDRAVELAERLGEGAGVEWAGLGARDILRLEAGLCLYGNDISEDTTPVEAGLAWCISECVSLHYNILPQALTSMGCWMY